MQDFRAQVRATIESHSKDSLVYKSRNQKEDKDIFYCAEEIGAGHWGLNDLDPNKIQIDLTEDDSGFPEGKRELRKHLQRERNPKVILEAKRRYIKEYGELRCQICGFSFKEKYGDIGENFIEAHHMIPVSELKEGDKTNIKDIVLVCSNCHRMIHRKRPWLRIDELKKLIKD